MSRLKKILLGSGLFGLGVLAGFAIAWFGQARLREHFTPPKPQETVTITLSALIDGADRFVFTRNNATNDHSTWGPPKNVLFDGVPWEDLTQPPAGWLALSHDLDLNRATVLTRAGRNLIVLEHTAEGFDVVFADTPNGSAKYEVTISIPKK